MVDRCRGDSSQEGMNWLNGAAKTPRENWTLVKRCREDSSWKGINLLKETVHLRKIRIFYLVLNMILA